MSGAHEEYHVSCYKWSSVSRAEQKKDQSVVIGSDCHLRGLPKGFDDFPLNGMERIYKVSNKVTRFNIFKKIILDSILNVDSACGRYVDKTRREDC